MNSTSTLSNGILERRSRGGKLAFFSLAGHPHQRLVISHLASTCPVVATPAEVCRQLQPAAA